MLRAKTFDLCIHRFYVTWTGRTYQLSTLPTLTATVERRTFRTYWELIPVMAFVWRPLFAYRLHQSTPTTTLSSTSWTPTVRLGSFWCTCPESTCRVSSVLCGDESALDGLCSSEEIHLALTRTRISSTCLKEAFTPISQLQSCLGSNSTYGRWLTVR